MGKKSKNKGPKGRNQSSKSSASTTITKGGKSQKEKVEKQAKGNRSRQEEPELKDDNEIVKINEDTLDLKQSDNKVETSDEACIKANRVDVQNTEHILNEKKNIEKEIDIRDTNSSIENATVSNEWSEGYDPWFNFKNAKGNWNTKQSKQTSSESENWRKKQEKDECEKQFKIWEKEVKKGINFEVVKEIEGDLFDQPADYSLAHCVGADLRMGSGIAVGFKQQFKNVETLLDQRAKQGGVAILPDTKNNRYIYYLVTKRESTGKPTYYTLWKSLWKMRDHLVKNQVKKLAIPRIGCGLDRLEWDFVKHMVEYLFKDTGTEITVCNFQEQIEALAEAAPKKQSKTCRLIKEEYHLTEIAAGTAIMYLTTERGEPDDIMKDLDAKFNFLSKARSQYSSKRLGDCVIVEDKDFAFFGCVVRSSTRDPISFESLKKCLQLFNKKNKSYGNNSFYYVGFQRIDDTKPYQDDLLNEKVITLLVNTLRDVDVYLCTGPRIKKY